MGLPNIKKNIKIPELIFCLYYWGFLWLHPFIMMNMSNSFLILLAFSMSLFTASVIYAISKKRFTIDKSIVFAFIIALLLLLDYAFRPNEYSMQYLKEYMYSGFVFIVIFSQIRNIRYILIYFSVFAIISLGVFGSDPLNEYAIFTDYMGYGFQLILPSFLAIAIGFHYLKIRWLIIFEIVTIILAFLFANRSVMLSIVLFYLLYYFFSAKNNIRFVIIISFAGCLLYTFAFDITTFAYDLLSKNGLNSYAINHYIKAFEYGINNDVLSNRDFLWNNALKMIENQNILIGSGSGFFQAQYLIYTHNMILDFLIFFGIIGFFLFLFFIVKSVVSVSKLPLSDVKIFGLLLFVLWFPKLLFSTVFIGDSSFWCFLAFPFLVKKLNETKFSI